MRKKEPRRWGSIIVTLFIALSMILSIFAIVLDNQSNQLKYNGYKFSLTNEGYKVKINGRVHTFQYYPSQLESFNLSDDTKKMLSESVALAMLFSPNLTADDLSYIDYSRFDFDDKIDKPVYFAITEESESYLLPILSCENATSEVPFLFFNISTDTSIVQNGNCIIMNAKLMDIIALEERISYQMLGVMR